MIKPVATSVFRANGRFYAPIIVSGLFMLATLAAIGINHTYYSFSDAPDWSAYKYEDVFNQPFSRTTVRLDGRRFTECTFDNVTFEYEGTGPFEFNPFPPTMTGNIQIKSGNPIVKGAMNMVQLHEISRGVAPIVHNSPEPSP